MDELLRIKAITGPVGGQKIFSFGGPLCKYVIKADLRTNMYRLSLNNVLGH